MIEFNTRASGDSSIRNFYYYFNKKFFELRNYNKYFDKKIPPITDPAKTTCSVDNALSSSFGRGVTGLTSNALCVVTGLSSKLSK